MREPALSLFAFALILLSYSGCGDRYEKMQQEAERMHDVVADHQPHRFATEHDGREVGFRVHWPPIDPAQDAYQSRDPLLSGTLHVSTGSDETSPQLGIRIELQRPDSESARERWNKQLAFPEYDWMSAVRVWDAEEKWLWPNLPFLLRAHGVEREQRYGGVDPGKKVDNDFAAVVVKRLDSDNHSSLVTAEWHSPPIGIVTKTTIVHTAISDDLILSVTKSTKQRFGVWLIYADFLHSSPPASWPKESEYDGGILSYFTIECEAVSDKVEIISAVCEAPITETGIQWKAWMKAGKPKRLKETP